MRQRAKNYLRTCILCDKEFMGQVNQLRCYDCSLKKGGFSQFKLNGIPPGTVGAIAELKVSVDLMTKGFHVFRALSPSCLCDLFAIKNDKQFDIEVRTTYRGNTGVIYKNKNKSTAKYFAWVIKDEIVYEPILE